MIEKDKSFDIKLKKIKEINYYTEEILAVSIFNSGNIIISSMNRGFTIWDTKFNLIYEKKIEKYSISSICIIDQETFYTGSDNGKLQLWQENKEDYEIVFEKIKINVGGLKNQLIHTASIQKILFSNNYLYTCSLDGYIKIIKKEREYTIIKSLSIKDKEYDQNLKIFTIIYDDDFKLLISSGESGTYLWKKEDFQKHKKICDTEAFENGLQIFEKKDDLIKFICGDKEIIIFSVDKKEKINIEYKTNKLDYECFSICVTNINNKIIYITGENIDNEDEENHKIRLYDKNQDNKVLKVFPYAHEKRINGLLMYCDSLISFSKDGKVIIWNICEDFF